MELKIIAPDCERSVGIYDGHTLLLEGGRTVVNPVDKFNGEEIWVGALPCRSILVRSARLPLTKAKDCERALPFQVESRLPFPLEEAQIASVVVGQEGGSTDLLFYVARRSEVETLLSESTEELHVITCAGVALAALVERLVDSLARRLVLFAEAEWITCAVVESGRLIASRQIDWDHSLEQAVLSLPKAEGDPLVCGPRWSEIEGEEIDLSDVGGQEWALPLGLALVGLQSKRVDFRTGSLVLARPWRRYRRRMATFAALSLLAAASLYLTGRLLIGREEQKLTRHYARVASIAGEATKEFSSRTSILESARELDKGGVVDLFPLEPALPSVGEVLTWLASHPQLSEAITLDSLRYQLVQYPHIKRSDARYQLRLEIEFEAQNSTAARAFHAALIEPNEWVDPGGEVQWSATKSGYRTSFLVRDRTFYPNRRRR